MTERRFRVLFWAEMVVAVACVAAAVLALSVGTTLLFFMALLNVVTAVTTVWSAFELRETHLAVVKERARLAAFKQRLVIERDETGAPISATGITPAPELRPFVFEHEGTEADMVDALFDLGFDASSIRIALNDATATLINIGEWDFHPPS